MVVISLSRVPAPLLVVDAPSLLYRAFFALPQSITDGDGHPVNGLLGMANLILFVVERRAPRAVVLCWGAEAAVYRTELYAPYHADRPPMPPELERQWRDAPAFFDAFGWTSASVADLEADDLLGSLARLEVAAGGEALLFTGDRDMFQCVGDAVTVLFPRGGRDGPEVVDADGVRERYGIEPAQVPDFIALRGDPSDKLPGVRGVGAKGAAALLHRHATLEDAFAAGRFPAQAEELRLFRRIATMDATAPLPPLPDQTPTWSRAAELARMWELDRLATRLEELAATRQGK